MYGYTLNYNVIDTKTMKNNGSITIQISNKTPTGYQCFEKHIRQRVNKLLRMVTYSSNNKELQI